MDNKKESNEINPIKYLNILFQYKWIVFLIIIVFLLAGLIISYTTKPVYKTSVVLAFPLNQETEQYPSTKYLNAYIKGDKILNEVISSLDYDLSPNDLQNKLFVKSAQKIVTVDVIDEDPQAAKNIANTLAKELVRQFEITYQEDVLKEQETTLHQELKQVEEELSETRKRLAKYNQIETQKKVANPVAQNIQDLKNQEFQLNENRILLISILYQTEQEIAKVGKPAIIKKATSPTSSFKPNYLLNLGVAGLLGLIIVLLSTYIIEAFKNRQT